jgi:hypothetical protein
MFFTTGAASLPFVSISKTTSGSEYDFDELLI